MFRLEHTTMDKAKAASLEPTIKGLHDLKSAWLDDYSINSTLRNKFRNEKNELKEMRKKETQFKERHCLSKDLKLEPESEEDSRIAQNIKFGQDPSDKSLSGILKKAKKSSIFGDKHPVSSKLKSENSIKLLKKVMRKS
ncbi:Coiled-coil domain-containing protein 130 [Thelohanellus kitauei]|uniref:Coiled-coil domain-containing protein 130 n=1 Tax=Thelohanellus kitauei TaxID=669202 RepID=A0A0C2MVS0_THEKT|nr:Coiled-coil domain-containing protein 130 [Thelohanellus kitauei]